MAHLHSSTVRLLALCVAAAVTFWAAAHASASTDVVHLKDGTVLEGEIVNEINGTIFLKISVGSIEHQQVITADRIDRIVRGATAGGEDGAEPDEVVIPDGATKVAFISLEEQVGPFFNKNAIERSVDVLKELPESQQPDVVVFVIDSGGGALWELRQIVPYLHEEVIPEFRTVAWIRSAISAAAMTSWVIPEIYMMREGNIGACTGYRSMSGGTEAMAGPELEEVLMWMEQVSKWGNKDPYIMRAMQVSMTLSCDIDEDGNITWYEGKKGEHLVSTFHNIVTFNALDAHKYGVSQGTADTKEELADAMGLEEWVEVGHGADEYQQEFRANVARAQNQINELSAKMQVAIQSAGAGGNRQWFERQIGIARRYLRQIKGHVDKAPSLKFYMGLTDEWFREQDQMLRDMLNNGGGGGGGGGSRGIG